MFESIASFFNSEDFMPHGHCFLWYPQILWLHVISDLLIAGAYYSIPLTLLYFARKRTDLPFRFLFYLFGAFILLCGTTHLMEIWVIWHPNYAIQGVLKAMTGIVSVSTAIVIWRIIPLALLLKSPTELSLINAELEEAYRRTEQTVEERTRELRALSERLQEEVRGKEAINIRLHQALQDAESANLAKSEFLANMSHEIRTPMNAVIGLSHILAASEPLTARQQEFIKTLQTSAKSLLGLLDDLLDISKIEAQTMELEAIPFSVMNVVEDTVSIVKLRAQEKGLTFSAESECVCIESRLFLGDPTRLRQIILNLCSNAIKFTEKGGVTIGVQCEETADPSVENIYVIVKDTGIGIPEDKLNSIFSKFVQADSSINRKYGGSGLGLTITKTLVEIMGGTITVESNAGSGSVFTICLPLKIAVRDTQHYGETDQALPAPLQASVRSGIVILLVEDYAPNVMVAVNFIEQFGYTAEIAGNGEEALAKFKNGHYALILMDVQMPGMNGLDATALIRDYERLRGLKRTPIIGLTAHVVPQNLEHCLAAGMDDCMTKPFDPVDLDRKIKEFLKDV